MKLQVKDLLGDYRQASPEEILKAADSIINKRYRRGVPIQSPQSSISLFRQKLAMQNYEVFAVLFLDNKHRVIEYKELFQGTIDSAQVHPRVVAQEALVLNAAAVIVAHNHPSGIAEPSYADKHITHKLKEALALVDIRLLDHIIIGDEVTSLAEQGLV